MISLPKLPSALAGLDMSAAVLYQKLKTEEGVASVTSDAIDVAIKKTIDPDDIEDRRLVYVKEFLMCLTKHTKQEQREAFQSLVVKVISEVSVSAEDAKQSKLCG